MDDCDYMHGASAQDFTPGDAPDWASVRMVLCGMLVLVAGALALFAFAQMLAAG